MCRLRTNFARLGDPLQGLHNRNAPLFPYGDFHLKVKRLTMICASLSLLQIMFAVHPGGGSFLSASLSSNLSHSLYSAARISPSGGDAAAGGRRGAFPSRQRRGCMVFPSPARAVCLFSPGEARL